MAEVKTTPVKAQNITCDDEAEKVPGAVSYYREGDRFPAGMIYTCPCGCGVQGSLRFRPTTSDRPSWEFTGTMDVPTLQPSVHHRGHWHGWLRNGVWTSV